MKKYKFIATVNNIKYYPKGFYYQGKKVILVGCEITNHTIRQKFNINDVDIKIEKL
jgi:hypothetical protein